jgi:hypothetical protein
MSFANEAERNAVVSVLSRGEFAQFKQLTDDIYERLDEVKKPTAPVESKESPSFDDIEPVEPPASDAKSVDVRETVTELVGQFNALLSKLKGN